MKYSINITKYKGNFHVQLIEVTEMIDIGNIQVKATIPNEKDVSKIVDGFVKQILHKLKTTNY